MSIKITRSYGELLNTGNYNNVKVDITVSSSVECTTPDEIKDTSNKLFKIAKMLDSNENSFLFSANIEDYKNNIERFKKMNYAKLTNLI
jgi:pyruvate formate-lyase activating enzyme-like uncharacterized protein